MAGHAGGAGHALTDEQFASWFGQRNDAILRRYFGDAITPAEIARIGEGKEAAYRVMVREHGIEPLPGVRRWLARLHDAGWRQAVASSAPPANIEVILDVLGLEDCFDAWVSAEEVAHGKPAPDVFLRAAEKAGRRAGALCRRGGCARRRGGRAPRRHAHDRHHLHGPPARRRHRRPVARGPARGCLRSARGEPRVIAAGGPSDGRGGSLFDTPADRRVAARAWAAALAASFVLIAITQFRSGDPDSNVYAGISARLATEPLERWIAPEWWGQWKFEGPFREHPIGIFILPALAARLGYPASQAAYAVNGLFQAASILLLQLIAVQLVSRRDARALGWIVQLMPIAFVFRIRANQDTRCWPASCSRCSRRSGRASARHGRGSPRSVSSGRCW